MAKRKSKDIYLMPEPSWATLSKLADGSEKEKLYRDCEYFVHYEVADKKTALAVHDWIEKSSGFDVELRRKLKKVPDMWYNSCGKYCFIWLKSGYMPENVTEFLQKFLPTLEHKALEIIEKQEEQKKDKPQVSIQFRMREQLEDLCSMWEQQIDDMITGNDFDIKRFEPYKDMLSYQEGLVKPSHAKIVKDIFQPMLDEALEIRKWEDPDIKEGFSSMSPAVRKTYVAMLEKIHVACDTLINTGKAQRKTRKPKAVSKERLVSKLKYQLNDSVLGIASINPIEIIDASEIWVYNTKNRKLGVYKVGGLATGLTVKGTTIVDFDSSSSVQKTLRKPAEQLKSFKGTARTKYHKAFDEIKSVDTKLNGRLNDTSIILKAF